MDITRLRIISWWVMASVACSPLRGRVETKTHREENHLEMEAGTGVMLAQAQRARSWKRHEGSSLSASEGVWPS